MICYHQNPIRRTLGLTIRNEVENLDDIRLYIYRIPSDESLTKNVCSISIENVSSTFIDRSVKESEDQHHHSTLPLNPSIQSSLKDLLKVSPDSHFTLIDFNVDVVVNSFNIDLEPYHYHLYLNLTVSNQPLDMNLILKLK